jgi:hypothetical protein
MSTGLDIAVAVILMLVGMLQALLVWIFLDFRREVFRRMRENGKHLDSLATTAWQLLWRIDGIESFLDETTDYRPVKIPSPRDGNTS